MKNRGFRYTAVSEAIKAVKPEPRFQNKLAIGVMALGLALSVAKPVTADTFTVSNTNDSGPGSFRQAILDANANPGNDRINFANVSGDINPLSDLPSVMSPVEIKGPGPGLLHIPKVMVDLSYDYQPKQGEPALISGLSIGSLSTGNTWVTNDFLIVDNTMINEFSTGGFYGRAPFNAYDGGSALINNSIISGGGTGIRAHNASHISIQNSVISSNERAFFASGIGRNLFGIGVLEINNSVIQGNKEVGIVGGGLKIYNSVITKNSGGLRVFEAGNVSIDGSTISDNKATGIRLASATTIYSYGPARLTIKNTTISGNAGHGIQTSNTSGAIYLDISNSTISNNEGFGIQFYGQEATIESSTISGNVNGGIFNNESLTYGHPFYGIYDANMKVNNSIVAGNSANGALDIAGETPVKVSDSLIQNTGSTVFENITPGTNLIGVDPLLAMLADNGGLTNTHALLAGSPAIDAGDIASCTAVDQRGISKPQGTGCDMGAYEVVQLTGSGAMGDYVWEDINGDGIQDSNEQGLGNITIELHSCSGELIDATKSEGNGHFTFSNIPTGSYQMRYKLPADYKFSPTNKGGNYRYDSNANPNTGLTPCLPMSAGQTRLAIDAGMVPVSSGPTGTGEMGDYVWEDLNKNGVQDSNEPGMSNITVELQTCSGTVVDSVTTDSTGQFRFTQIPVGDYQMQYILPASHDFSPVNQGGNYRYDSNANQTTGLTPCLSMKDGQSRLAVDAGMIPKGSATGTGMMGDYVWNDLNADGIQDSNEPGLNNVSIDLLSCSGDLMDTTYSDANGNFRFPGIAPGDYQMRYNLLANYRYSPEKQGSNYRYDSNVNTSTGLTPCLSIADGQQRLAVDGGMVMEVLTGEPEVTVTINDASSVKPGPVVSTGETLNWRYTVSNPTGSELTNVVVRGRQKLPTLGSWETLCTIGTIQPAEEGSCMTTSTAETGTYKMLVTINALDAQGNPIQLSEQAFYQGQ